LVVVRDGQLVLTDSAEHFCDRVTYSDGYAIRLSPAAATPSLVMEPKYPFGQPVLRGVRTEVLGEEFRAGAPRESIAELYVLTAEEVGEALRFEMIVANSRVAWRSRSVARVFAASRMRTPWVSPNCSALFVTMWSFLSTPSSRKSPEVRMT
jgi:uncharacterized protein (DUF433 family)